MTDLMPRRAAGIPGWRERVVLWQPKTVTSSRWELWGLGGGWGEGSCHFLERSLRDESDFRLGWSRRGMLLGEWQVRTTGKLLRYNSNKMHARA